MKGDAPITFQDIVEKRVTIAGHLSRIDWKLLHHGCDHWYFYNHKGKCTGMYLLFPETDGRICYEMEEHGKMPSFTFYLKDLVMEILDDNCVSFSGKTDKSIFILCPNYDKEKQQMKPASQRKTKKPQHVIGEQTPPIKG